MSMRVKERRLMLIELDIDDLDEAAEVLRCTAQQFVALAVADAIAEALEPRGERSVSIAVDGVGMTVECRGSGGD